MKIIWYLLGIISLFLVLPAVPATLNQVTFNDTSPSYISRSNIEVQVLKYDPYPVSPGEWFDVWIQVQNVKEEDVTNAVFELSSEYPFSSTDTLIRNYNLISGKINAYKMSHNYDASQVVLKYRVKVADNAPEGTSDLKLKINDDKNNPSAGFIIYLPITIGKTKTDFDIVMQDSTIQGTSFAISNIGDNAAIAVTLSVEPQDNVAIKGPKATILGNLAPGDFTTVTFQVSPNSDLEEMKLKIAYTDIAGVRNEVEKIVPVSIYSAPFIPKKTSAGFISMILPAVVGLILGIIFAGIYRKIRKRKS